METIRNVAKRREINEWLRSYPLVGGSLIWLGGLNLGREVAPASTHVLAHLKNPIAAVGGSTNTHRGEQGEHHSTDPRTAENARPCGSERRG